MQVAGIRRIGDRVEIIEVDELRPLAGDEVLLEVMAAGVGNWDEFVRTGGWDVGARPPMALGVEAAGTVMAAGRAVSDWAPGDAVMTHPVPLRDQGAWAPRLIAPAGLLARKPDGASWEAAAAFPVPALTAEQVLGDTLARPRPAQELLSRMDWWVVRVRDRWILSGRPSSPMTPCRSTQRWMTVRSIVPVASAVPAGLLVPSHSCRRASGPAKLRSRAVWASHCSSSRTARRGRFRLSAAVRPLT